MTDDALDVDVVIRRLWAGRRYLIGGLLAGIGIAGLAYAVTPRRWDARASVLTSVSSSAGLLGRVAVPEGLTAAVAGASGRGPLDTELELLRSRRIVAPVLEQIRANVVVRRPGDLPALSILRRFEPLAAFEPFRLSGVRVGDQWRLTGDGLDTTVAAGQGVLTPAGHVVLSDSAPASFRLTLLDAEDAWRRVRDRLSGGVAGGDIVEVKVRWDDRTTGAVIANGIVASYVRWRAETAAEDDGNRADQVRLRVDSIEQTLSGMLDSLRRFQDRSDAAEPTVRIRAIGELLGRQRMELQAVNAEVDALREFLARIDVDSTQLVRSLPAIPPLQRSPAINELLISLQRLDAERSVLLGTRTARDPSVAARETSIRALQGQLVPLATTYLEAMRRTQTELRRGVDSLATVLARIPTESRTYLDIAREVERLTKSLVQLQAQLLQVELASSDRGGRPRIVDVAVPARRPVVPRLSLFVVLGVAGGSVVGAVFALARRPSAVAA